MKISFFKILIGGLITGIIYASLMSSYYMYNGEAFNLKDLLIYFAITFIPTVLIFSFLLKKQHKK